MEAATKVNPRLKALVEAGTSPWLDQIRRSLIEGGELQRLVEEDSLRGVTSNPAIFEKAILGSDDYDEEINKLSGEGLEAKDIYENIAVKDVQMACDVLRPVHDATDGYDGYVSLEVEPSLAHDTEGSLGSARDLWGRVDRPNVMIKIPGTEEGVQAIEDAIADGINVNVTLLFSVESYETIAEAYIRGLERRHEKGESLDIHSVASFFVSRVDSEVDKRLADLGREDLEGIAAVANARAAYMSFKEMFYGERFADLRAAGAPVQRPLWASTGVKDPKYPETKYVDDLVAPDTVNTMPMATLTAAGEKSEISGPTADQDPAEDLRKLADAGIDMGDVTKTLLNDGIDKFIDPFKKLVDGVETIRKAVLEGRPPTIEAGIPDDLRAKIKARAKQSEDEEVARRVWRKDETLWGGPGPEIGNRLGWLTVADNMLEAAPELRSWAESVAGEGYTDAVLCGMGGSSLAPEVFRLSYGEIPGALNLHVLDSTDSGAIKAVEDAIDLDKTLFIVSTKSGGTIETLSLYKHFRAKIDDGQHFVAVTDPGSGLEKLAEEQDFRRIFLADPNIGGRYSALTHFGIVPAALMGVDVEAVLNRALVAEQNCAHYGSTADNSGLWLGLAMGELAREGRDKVTFFVSQPIEGFSLWVEQLIAESTGKEGKGILPVAGEPIGAPEAYGDDRVFVYLRNGDEPDEDTDAKVKALADAGHPTVTLTTEGGPSDLGRIFFFAEFAVAVSGWVLGINAFNQPNVQEAKDATNKVLEGYESSGSLPDVADASDEDLRALLAEAGPGRYVAIMGYLEPSEEFDAAVTDLRVAIRDARRVTTTYGYGPRFLHSTGQLHKGGPKTGIFLQLLHDVDVAEEIPGSPFDFTTLKHAQSIGDIETLKAHELPAARVHLEGDPVEAVRALTERVKGLL
ncbi:MAG: bifunctional transaldolase/phosoglucose isomerase [Thermoleophilaceae bacterium]|nr:bifunctional transaldolase/phosoglucose isomerase [Thermoleophilaceae bacterium]